VLAELAKVASNLRRSATPRPYWPQRQGHQAPGSYLDPSGLRRAFANLVEEFERQGYLDQAFPRPCVDDQDIRPT